MVHQAVTELDLSRANTPWKKLQTHIGRMKRDIVSGVAKSLRTKEAAVETPGVGEEGRGIEKAIEKGIEKGKGKEKGDSVYLAIDTTPQPTEPSREGNVRNEGGD